MLTSAISGGVSLILAYGQTGSGKTHTIQALQHQLANDLFDAAATFARDHFPSSEVPSTDVFAISATIFEVQGNKARDLLVPGPVEIAEDKVRPFARRGRHGTIRQSRRADHPVLLNLVCQFSTEWFRRMRRYTS